LWLASRGARLLEGRWPSLFPVLHLMCMKRTNLVLDEDLLEEATRLSGERTYSRTVERALEEFVKRAKARRILDLAGSGLWEGNLPLVREDRGVYRSRKRGSR
jgi:Arc/MetJ family transcription regulator